MKMLVVIFGGVEAQMLADTSGHVQIGKYSGRVYRPCQSVRYPFSADISSPACTPRADVLVRVDMCSMCSQALGGLVVQPDEAL
jgi:hypothetical protein